MRTMIGIVVPVKDFANAKQRLDRVLSPMERRRLAQAMLCDVLAALTSTVDPASISVATKDEQVIMMANTLSVSVIREAENRGETEAVALAVDVLVERGVKSMLVVPADIPLITGEDVERVLRAGRSANVVLVPSRDERGTNAALLSPPNALPLRFGSDSFYPHLESARSRGWQTTVLHLPNIALDIDTPADLAALAARPARTRAQALLEEGGWLSRCK